MRRILLGALFVELFSVAAWGQALQLTPPFVIGSSATTLPSGLSIPSPTISTLTVSSGGAAITGNSTVTGTFGSTGTASFGTGSTNWITASGSSTNPTIGTSGGALALTASAGYMTFTAAANPMLALVASGQSADQTSWGVLAFGNNFEIGARTDALGSRTQAYLISRGTTYNVASHTWYTSTVAGTPVQGMQLTTSGTTINNTLTLPQLTTGTNADVVCVTSGFTLVIQAAASCTISSKRFKNQLGTFKGDALGEVMALGKPQMFTLKSGNQNPDWNAGTLQIGFYAEDVAAVDTKLALYEDDHLTPKSYRQDGLLAVAIGAIQELKAENDNLRQRIEKLESRR